MSLNRFFSSLNPSVFALDDTDNSQKIFVVKMPDFKTNFDTENNIYAINAMAGKGVAIHLEEKNKVKELKIIFTPCSEDDFDDNDKKFRTAIVKVTTPCLNMAQTDSIIKKYEMFLRNNALHSDMSARLNRQVHGKGMGSAY